MRRHKQRTEAQQREDAYSASLFARAIQFAESRLGKSVGTKDPVGHLSLLLMDATPEVRALWKAEKAKAREYADNA